MPQRGEKREIVEMALTNAREQLGRAAWRRIPRSANCWTAWPNCSASKHPPRRIEVYDNSHIQGTNALGGMIVAGPDGFEKGEYRKFNIKSTELTPGDDYAMMREVLTRRFARLVKESGNDDARAKWPDLALIDGGPGQLSVAQAVLEDLGVEDVLLVGISKGPDRDAGREHFYMQGPRALPPRSQEPGALLPAAPARRGAPLRHRQPPQEAHQGHRRQSAGRDRGRRRRPQARAAAAFRLGPRGFRRPALPISKAWRASAARWPKRFTISSIRAADAALRVWYIRPMNIPNILTMFRIFLVPVFVVAFVMPGRRARIGAFVIFCIAGISDALDGFAARKLNGRDRISAACSIPSRTRSWSAWR